MKTAHFTAVAVIVSALMLAPALASEFAVVFDANDVGSRLDIRSVVIEEKASGLTKITVTFWNPVPTWLLQRRGLWIEADPYVFRIFRNAQGLLRIAGGDLGSTISRRPAHHPDPFTFVARAYIFGTEPTPTSMRGLTTRKADCPTSGSCLFEQGKRIDATPRVTL